ncbi:MAG TPA: prepilin-type N-terminal cleavage/methylation domain-containing protein [Steroidobacteraceae bacterium]|jgi:MSHA pilin protein MshA
MFRSSQRGFTMIELVVVIVILGILAAFALPRFMGLENQARVAALNGMAGSIRSAANMAHGVWMANGNVSPITVDGNPITIVNGYPNAAGIQTLIQDTTGFKVTVAAPATTFSPIGARTVGSCYVNYNQAANANTAFTLTYPGNVNQIQTTLQTNC